MNKILILMFLILSILYTLHTVRAQEINLYDIEVDYDNQWFIGDQNDIIIIGKTINNSYANIDGINITLINKSLADFQIIRKTDYFYKIRFDLKNESANQNLKFILFVSQGPKSIVSPNNSILIKNKPSPLLPKEYNQKLSNMVNNIKDNYLKYLTGVVITLIIIMGIQYLRGL